MGKAISILIIAALLFSLTACGRRDESLAGNTNGQSSSSEAQSNPPQESASVIPAEYTSLMQLCDTIIKPGLYWQCELPGVEYGREHIAVTKELQDEIYKILTEHEPLFQPDMPDDDSRDRTGGAIILDIGASDDGIYPNGKQLAFAAIIPLGPNDPAAPNTTFLAISNAEDCYTYPAEVYDKLLSLLQDNVVETRADLKGEYIRMVLSQTETYPVWGDTLECGNVLLHSSSDSSDYNNLPAKWQIEAFDLTSGESLYRVESSGYGDKGGIMRLSLLNGIPDYDYVVFFEKGYAYRDSKDSSKEVYFALPDEVKLSLNIYKNTVAYDEHGDYIIWVENDGIHLRVAKQDGITQKLILPNTELPALFPDPNSYNGTLSYVAPRFICGGTKVVAAVYSDSQMQDVGVAVFDIASGKISSTFPYMPPAIAYYPITDLYVVNRSMGGLMKMLDAQTGEVTDIPSLRIGESYDYKTYIVEDYKTLDAWNAPSYICDISDIDDRSKPLLLPGNPYAMVTLPDVTENYAIFSVTDFDGNWIAAAEYR